MSTRFELEAPDGGTFEDDPLALVPGTKRRKPRPRLQAALASVSRIAGYRMDGTGLGWVSVGVGVAFSGALLLRLFVSGAIGLSDQGDGQRLTCGLGLRAGNAYNTPVDDLVYTTYFDHRWYGEDCPWNTYGQPYNSSQLYLLQLAKWLTPLLRLPGDMDLRALGVVCALVLGVLAALMFVWIPGSLVGKGFVVTGVWLIVADATFAGYFVSAYSDTGAILGVLALMVAALALWRAEQVHWWHVAVIAAIALFTATTKTQAATYAVVAVPLMLSRRVGAQKHGKRYFLQGRWFALAASGGLIAAVGQYLRTQPARFGELNQYNAVFVEMLPHSKNPEQDLVRLGLDPTLISGSGSRINSANSVTELPGYQGFLDKTSTWDLFSQVYLHEPFRLLSMMGRGLVGMARLRVDYIYSYPWYSGRPDTLEWRVSLFYQVWRMMFSSLPLLIIVLTLASCLAFVIVLKVCTTQEDRSVGAVGLFLAVAALAQFWAVNLSEGASDLIKHLMLTDFTTGLVLILGAYSVIVLRSSVIREKGTSR
ncbi:glycan biosynthesis hexose transferase WsfD [Rhodococcus sp. OK302]|uniref:glycan biosynthesis hexose transferase WsfD n=1 Tax=Rhodococcus sp. OK302 TaxID=1882769 RepID=UPI000B93BA90|nr:hypothetical protein [Rhodococcus sp. OK302]OYD61138.1 hypothetical protein BDB13_6083 [Rhodococcus sp. OK302]